MAAVVTFFICHFVTIYIYFRLAVTQRPENGMGEYMGWHWRHRWKRTSINAAMLEVQLMWTNERELNAKIWKF